MILITYEDYYRATVPPITLAGPLNWRKYAGWICAEAYLCLDNTSYITCMKISKLLL
jgi:hypothetical protein